MSVLSPHRAHPHRSTPHSQKFKELPMASTAQKLANQQNATLSSGPTSDAGKRKSSQNARTHGLLSTSIDSLPECWRESFQSLHELLFADHSPETTSEELAVRELAHATFLSLQVDGLQLIALEAYLAAPKDADARAEFDRMSRYSARLQRRVRLAEKALETLKLNRELAREVSRLASQYAEKTVDVSPCLPLNKLLVPAETQVPREEFAFRCATATADPEPEIPLLEEKPNEPNPVHHNSR